MTSKEEKEIHEITAAMLPIAEKMILEMTSTVKIISPEGRETFQPQMTALIMEAFKHLVAFQMYEMTQCGKPVNLEAVIDYNLGQMVAACQEYAKENSSKVITESDTPDADNIPESVKNVVDALISDLSKGGK